MAFIKGSDMDSLRWYSCLVYVCGISIAFLLPVWSQQPTSYTSIKPDTVWPADNGIHIDCHGGNIIYQASSKTYYWYGEHRSSPSGVSCYSSKDLYNWKYEGVVMQKGSIPTLERPKVVYNQTTGKYVMWFHYDDSGYGLAHLGVAVSDSAKGPYTLVNHFPPNGHQSRDIGMFCDDNGKVYIIYAADPTNVTVRIVELTADYLNVTTNDSDTKAHCEGPCILKKNGVYYLVTSLCNGWSPNKSPYYVSYCTATNVMGTYTNKGNPFIGAGDGVATTLNAFYSQPCSIFQIPGYSNGFMYMGDDWTLRGSAGGGSANSRYVFLPIVITTTGVMQISWLSSWNLSLFTPTGVDDRSVPSWKNGAMMRAASKSRTPALYDIRGKKLMSADAGSREKLLFRTSAGMRIMAFENGVPELVITIP
jgi:beta-galactosidase